MSISARAVFTPRSALGRFITTRITPGVRASAQAAVDQIQQVAQGYCPVDTGALRESITTELVETGKTIVGTVGPHTDYANFVEYGTGIRGAASDGAGSGPYSETWPGMPAQPYMRPAFDETKPGIVDLFASNIAASIK